MECNRDYELSKGIWGPVLIIRRLKVPVVRSCNLGERDPEVAEDPRREVEVLVEVLWRVQSGRGLGQYGCTEYIHGLTRKNSRLTLAP
jgi:hypothetical protein